MATIEQIGADLWRVLDNDRPIRDTHGIDRVIRAALEAAYQLGRNDAVQAADYAANEADEAWERVR